MLSIRLFGEVELRCDGELLPPLDSARAESLLAYLLVHRGARVPRQRLAFLLWPDSPERQARTNLRHVLHTLRRALPHPDTYIEATDRILAWRPDAPFTLDVAEFEAALGAGDDAAAVAIYRGDLLAGGYEEWVGDERERLRHAQLAALERLAAQAEAEERAQDAIAHAERLLRQDPLREEQCRRLIRLYDARGETARAVRAYHECAAALERERGVAPSAATRAAYEALLPGAPPVQAAPGLVGRAEERARLAAIWRAASGGQAQLVLVIGEAGVGKTRLIEQLRGWCEERGVPTAEARSYPAEGALAYGPVGDWLRSPVLTARRVRLDRGRRAELARVLPEISGLPRPEPLPEEEQRQRLFDALAHALLAGSGPRLLVADDLHWADAETLRFVHYLIRSRPAAPLLIAATARHEELDPLAELITGLSTLDRFTQLRLEPLSRRETVLLAERLSGHVLERTRADRLFAETEGNPLFVIETLRAGWSGRSPRVQAVIEARLARLSSAARELAGVAATLGREFSADVLAAVGGGDALVAALDELWRRDIVRERKPDTYDFSHDRIREVAYEALGPARRQDLHRRVARALQRSHADEPGRVALHYDRAGERGAAVAWYERAAAAAQRMHAGAEAIRLLERALELAGGGEAELAVLTALIPLVANADGFGSPRVDELHRRALELTPGEPPAPLLRSLALAALSRSDFPAAERYGEQLRMRGERDGDAVLLVESDYALGVAAFWQAHLSAARTHFEAAVARYRPEHRTTHLFRYGLDPQVVCQSRLANTLGFLGERGAALRARDAALATAAEIGHAATLDTALVFAALLALDLGEISDLRRHADALAESCRDRSVRAAAVALEAYRGYLEVVDGDAAGGLSRIGRALDDPGRHAPGHRAVMARILLAAATAARDAKAVLAAADALLSAGAGAPLWAAEARRWRDEFARNARGTPSTA
jgi:DNA-binding SARP family transcriptional activator